MATKNAATVVLFKKSKVTKGAVAFVEVDEAGNEVQSDESGKKIGSLYLRKSGLPNGSEPTNLKVTIEVID